uniref:Uncharacterized protein n=1 Tax=Panagrolaimus sp. JU765 TaxID=591449 RepID=A0AC34QDK5_9BILA
MRLAWRPQKFFTIVFGILFINSWNPVKSLKCYDGSHCDFNCNECEGVACLRIVRQTSNGDFYYSRTGQTSGETEVAMTCLPSDTRSYDLEPEGCRTNPINNVRTCVCYGHDYCNHSSSSSNFLPVLIFATIFIFCFR